MLAVARFYTFYKDRNFAVCMPLICRSLFKLYLLASLLLLRVTLFWGGSHETRTDLRNGGSWRWDGDSRPCGYASNSFGGSVHPGRRMHLHRNPFCRQRTTTGGVS